MNLNDSRSDSQKRPKKGFALILTLALISFVFLLVITLVNQVRVEFTFTESRQNQILAKAHARMGMMIAIGEIQKHLGPDMRVSATADIYDERIESGKKYFNQGTGAFREKGFGFLHDKRIQYPTDPDIDYEEIIPLTENKFNGPDGLSSPAYRADELVKLHTFDVNLTEEQNSQITSFFYKLPLGQRQWTGVWKHRGMSSTNGLNFEGISGTDATRDLPFNNDDGGGITDSWSTDDSFDHHPAVEVAWLVSGNEGWKRKLAMVNKSKLLVDFIEIPDGRYIDDEGNRVIPGSFGNFYGKNENPWLDHEQVVTKLNQAELYHHPLESIPEPLGLNNPEYGSKKTVWLLRNPLLSDKYDPQNRAHQINWKDYLVAEPVKVMKTPVILAENANIGDPWDQRSGTYAFWVGDEGVKAKINISEPTNENTSPPVPLMDELSRLKVASSPNISDYSFGFEFVGEDDPQRKDLISILSSKELLSEKKFGQTDARAANYYYHSMTTDSFGVLSDLRTGGLKRDLSLAFLENNKSALWQKDFNGNWIYRDRVNSKKYFPLYDEQAKKHFKTEKIKKNQWLDSPDRFTVLDYDAMLAGPLWSVLADYHNLSGQEILELSPPTQFPRTVGDNALIFTPGLPPKSPDNAFGPIANDKTFRFFNSFSDKYSNPVRPEPKNHPITPILTRLYINFNVALKDTESNEPVIAINPSVTLFNPYDKPLKVENLYIFLPVNMGVIHLQTFDLAEYDLFRKWWMFVQKPDFETKWDPKGRKKDPNQPWPLFQVSLYDSSSPLTAEFTEGCVEYGLLSWIQADTSNSVGKESPKMKIVKQIREIDGENRPVYVYYHENPRDGVTGEFVLTSYYSTRLDNKPIQLKNFIYKIEDTLLEPGENACFNVLTMQEEDYSGSNEVEILLQRGDTSQSFALKTGVKNFSFGSYEFGMQGFPGKNNESDDKFIFEKGKFVHKPAGNFNPTTVTMFKWNGEGRANPNDPKLAQKIHTINRSFSGNSGRNDQVQLATAKLLKQVWDQRLNGSQLPGHGWKLELLLPGNKEVENISLNDFNVRHLVHSDQHGMGSFLKARGDPNFDNSMRAGSMGDGTGYIPFKKGESGFIVETLQDVNGTPTIDPTLKMNFTVPNDNIDKKYPDPRPKANPPLKLNDTKDKAFPDLYKWKSNVFDLNQWISWESDFDVASRSSNLNDRAAAINFSTTSNYTDLMDGYPDSLFLYPDQTFNKSHTRRTPIWNNSTTKGGFNFASSSSVDPAKAQKKTVLFETPSSGPVLSLFQYRHANLNSYLHGPSYALGNSYATTQVGRHRSYGRVQTIQYAPTSERDLSVDQIAEMFKMQKKVFEQAFIKYGDVMAPSKIVENFAMTNWYWEGDIDIKDPKFTITKNEFEGFFPNAVHDIDLNQGFAPWRKDNSGSSHNHQNTTIDHSYYLNRALLDGFFLSGVGSGKKASSVDLTPTGQRYRPFLSTKSGKKIGNHRIVGFFRNNDWNETSYSSLSKEPSTKDDPFRYQSVAGDLLVDGAFNVNSTSVDAWIAQLTSLRGVELRDSEQDSINTTGTTPVLRFLEQPEANSWNKLRLLSDEEIAKLAKAIVKQVKLAGPFLSFSDFVNRRLAPGPENKLKEAKGSTLNYMKEEVGNWNKVGPENRFTVTGLRGPIQSAIADSGLNNVSDNPDWNASWIPQIPTNRWFDNGSFNASEFGLFASSTQTNLYKNGSSRYWGQGQYPPGYELPSWTQNKDNIHGKTVSPGGELPNIILPNVNYKFRPDKFTYRSNEYGEAPENLLAVENLATGANKPGWVMQSDLLSPLAPVSSARSDTFTIRVMGEFGKDARSNAWIELVVQRTPDYVKANLDNPHHRPHEPFRDKNFNGYWDNGFGEEWVDLNRNGGYKEYPDMPGETEAKYRDGMASDLRLNLDPEEEDLQSSLGVSFIGINQRFGRKFKIVRFRWLREQDV